jgi:hypothetical protein
MNVDEVKFNKNSTVSINDGHSNEKDQPIPCDLC